MRSLAGQNACSANRVSTMRVLPQAIRGSHLAVHSATVSGCVEDDQVRPLNDRIAPAVRASGERVYSGLDVEPRSGLAADDALPVRGASVS